MEWISVKDRLPKAGQPVLTVGAFEDAMTAYVTFDPKPKWFPYMDHEDWIVGITHWMPLPEPPKEDK